MDLAFKIAVGSPLVARFFRRALNRLDIARGQLDPAQDGQQNRDALVVALRLRRVGCEGDQLADLGVGNRMG
jgi:hypothetical protein